MSTASAPARPVGTPFPALPRSEAEWPESYQQAAEELAVIYDTAGEVESFKLQSRIRSAVAGLRGFLDARVCVDRVNEQSIARMCRTIADVKADVANLSEAVAEADQILNSRLAEQLADSLRFEVKRLKDELAAEKSRSAALERAIDADNDGLISDMTEDITSAILHEVESSGRYDRMLAEAEPFQVEVPVCLETEVLPYHFAETYHAKEVDVWLVDVIEHRDANGRPQAHAVYQVQ